MYGRKLGSRTLTFGHEGVLYKNSFIMYDKETDSLWVHTTGEAVKGSLKGSQLEFLPSVATAWGTWRKKHSGTRVLTGRKAKGFMGAFNLKRDRDRYGLSVGQGRKAKLYRFVDLEKLRVVNDEFDGKEIVVVFDPDGLVARAYERGGRAFEWKNARMIDDRELDWDPLTGSSGKETLKGIAATPWLIERWRAFYPKGEEFKP